MKRARLLPTPNTLQAGHYIFWQQRTYQVIASDPNNALLLHVHPLPEGPETTLSLLELLAIARTSPSAPLFAPSLLALYQQIAERYGLVLGTMTHDLPHSYVVKARIVTSVVQMVRKLVSVDEQRAHMRGEAIAHQQAIRRALLTVNKTTIQMEVRGTSQDIQLHAGLTSYYKYERLYATYQGDEAQIAASFRRSTFRLTHMSPAQLHFIDTCLLLYYGHTRSTKTRVYQLAQDILQKRTGGYWVNPERCGTTIPENVVTELLDLTIPMQALLDNPEKKALLTQIEMPSTGWFSGYTRYIAKHNPIKVRDSSPHDWEKGCGNTTTSCSIPSFTGRSSPSNMSLPITGSWMPGSLMKKHARSLRACGSRSSSMRIHAVS